MSKCIPFDSPAEAHRALAGLANFIEDLPHSRFTMPQWSDYTDRTERSCGTAGCACGWAATVHAARGWYFVLPKVNVYATAPIWNHRCGCDAFAAFFQLDPADAELITMPAKYDEEFGTSRPTPVQTAKRIRDVLRRIDPAALDEPTACAVPETASLSLSR